LVAVLGVLFAGGALVLLIPAVAAGRLPMLFGAMALACALGALACRLGYVRLKATIAERDAQAIAALAHASRFEASGRGIWLGLLFVPLIAMFGFGLFAALREGRIGMVLLCSVLLLAFLLAGAELMRQALRPGPMLAMDLRGIDHATFGRIPWGDVIGLNHSTVTVRHSTQHFLDIGVRTPHRFYDQLSWVLRLKHRKWESRTARYGALKVPLNMLSKPPEVIYGAAVQFRGKVDAPWLEAWFEKMTPQSIDTMLALQDVHRDTVRATDAGDMAAAQDALERWKALQPAVDRHVEETVAKVRSHTRTGWIIGGILVLLLALKAWAVLA
jgi:hypothetical protein